MTVTLTTIMGLPLLNVGDLLANCAIFRTLMDADDVTEAKARTFFIETDEDVETQASFPRCIVGYQPYAFGSELIGTTNWTTKGPVEVRIEVATPTEHQSAKQQEVIWFNNSIGTLFEQIRSLVTGGGGYQNVVNLKIGMMGRLDTTEYNGLRGMGCELIFEWAGP